MHIQDRIVKDKEDIIQMWGKNAKYFVCVSPEVAKAVGHAARVLVKDDRFQQQRGERFVSDVFAEGLRCILLVYKDYPRLEKWG